MGFAGLRNALEGAWHCLLACSQPALPDPHPEHRGTSVLHEVVKRCGGELENRAVGRRAPSTFPLLSEPGT